MNVTEIIKTKVESGQNILTEFESKELLQEIGISIPGQKLTTLKEENGSCAL